MRKSTDGKEYEEMVHRVYEHLCSNERFTIIDRNVRIPGPDGIREIDLLVRHTHAGIDYLTAIECRGYNGKLDVTHVDGFASKIVDIKANKGIIVSKKGFSKTARQKAKRLGIGLCQIDNAAMLLASMALEIPIIVVIVELDINTQMSLQAMKNTSVDKNAMRVINDIKIVDIVSRDIQTGVIDTPKEKTRINYLTDELVPPYWIRDIYNEKLFVENIDINVDLIPTFFAGTSNHFPDFLMQHDLDKDQGLVLIPDDFRVKLTSQFSQFKRMADIPSTYAGALVSVTTANELPGYTEDNKY